MSNLIQNLEKNKKFATEITVKQIPIEMIFPDPNQVRINFDEDKLKELADSIKENGIQNPIHVRIIEDRYIVLTGERRYRASKIAGKPYLPCIIHEESMSESEIKAFQLIENLQRENLSAIETARGFDSLKNGGMGQREIARHLGISEATISKGITVLKRLPEDWLKQIEDTSKTLSLEEIYNVAKEQNKKKRISLYQKLMENFGAKVEVEVEKQEEENKPKSKDIKTEFKDSEIDTVWEFLKKEMRKDKKLLCLYITPKRMQEILEKSSDLE